MFSDRWSLEIRLGMLGFLLSVALVMIAWFVDVIHLGLAFGFHSIPAVYSHTPVQWIILSSPLFLTSIFYIMGKVLRLRELKLEQRTSYEKEQFHLLEEFVAALEAGDFSVVLPGSFDNRSLANKLAHFKDKLVADKKDEERRLWEKEGLAKFGELMRSHHSVEALTDDVVKFLVKYTKSNQASVFVVHGAESANPELVLHACYAYDRKKYATKVIQPGSGLVGQCYLEKEKILLYDVPDNYVKITSGLGEAAPSFIVIMPMKVNDVVKGVLEMAAFRKLERYEINFVEKACEVFAASLESVMVSENVKQLLRESQQQTEELRTQDEEMRQNMEELQSIQEQMSRQLEENNRIKKNLEAREKVLGYTTILSESDLYGTITYVNSKFCEVSQYKPEELIGKGHNYIRHPDMPREVFKKLWATIKKGEVFRGIVKNKKKDGTHYWVDATIVPVIEDGVIVKYIGARYHIEDDAVAQKLFDEQNAKLGIVRSAVLYQ